MFTIGYTIYCFYILANNLQETDNSVTTLLDLGQLGNVSFDTTSIKPFLMIKGSKIDSSLFNLSRYINFYFTNVAVDYTIKDSSTSKAF